MKIRILSDIHNEMWRYKRNTNYHIPEGEDDENTVLILAGDIDTRLRAVKYANLFSDRFRDIIVVLGNHDYWGTVLGKNSKIERINNERASNVHLLDNSSLVIDDVRFLGGTLWADLNDNDPLTALIAQDKMNDYKKIRYFMNNRYPRLRPNNLIAEHNRTKNMLLNELFYRPVYDNSGFDKTVVVTHHAPCELSKDGRFVDDIHGNYSYYSDLTYMMGELIDLWVHGHVHQPKDYEVYGTRVVANPVGYIGERVHSDPLKTIDI